MTYNIKAHDLRLYQKFLDRGVMVNAFENFDGGGFNFFIIEFQRRKDMDAYRREMNESEIPQCWIEHDDGEHEDISA